MYSRKLFHHETDANGVCHFSNYLKLIEELLDSTLFFNTINPNTAFIITSLDIKYLKPIKYGDDFNISIISIDIKRTWFVLGFLICGQENTIYSEAFIKIAEVNMETSKPSGISKKTKVTLESLKNKI